MAAEAARKRKRMDLCPSDDEDDSPETVAVGTKGRYLGVTDEHGEWFAIPGYSPDKVRGSSEGFVMVSTPKRGWDKPWRGSLRGTGYRVLTVYGQQKQAHDLLCTAFYGVKSDPTLTAQHGPGGKGLNSRANLLGWATKKQQRNEHRSTPRPDRRGQPILVWPVGASEADAVCYESAVAADKATGAQNLCQVANGNYRYSGGYVAKWAPPPETQDDLPGEGYAPAHNLAEEWRAASSALWVSNRGRAWPKHNRGDGWGYKYTPVVGSSLYAMVRVNGKQKLFHIVVFDVFYPGVRGNRDIDHLDRTKGNNNLQNLGAKTRAENNRNVTHKHYSERHNSSKKPMRGRPVGTTEWVIEAASVRDMADALSLYTGEETHRKHLGPAAKAGKTYKGWEFEYVGCGQR